MLLGQTPTIREGVLTFVKIGLVLTLATSWPAYQALVYDIILRAPAELASTIGGAAGLPGSGRGLVARIDGVPKAPQVLAVAGLGAPPLVDDRPPLSHTRAPPPLPRPPLLPHCLPPALLPPPLIPPLP